MQNTYVAIIKIPFTLSPDGSMTPHQDRYAIDFQSIDKLPPINREEYGTLLQQLLSSNNDIPIMENNTITQSDEGDRSEGDRSEGDKSENENQLMVSIHELMNRPPPQQRNNISFKHKPRRSRTTHTVKKRPSHVKDVDSPAPP